MGTAPLAVRSLQALVTQPDFHVAAVVTQPDRPQGRKLQLKPSAVKEAALSLGLPVLQPERIRNEAALAELAAHRPDLIVVAAYGQILPKALLEQPRFGCLNVHTSLLPRYRGAAPIQWAILNGDPETGVTIMQMDVGMDTGPILSQRATPIGVADTAETLHDRLAELGAGLLVETIPGWVAGTIPSRPQPAEGASHARKIEKQDGLLDWQKPATALWNRVRGLVPWPGAFVHRPLSAQGDHAILKVWEARFEEGGDPAVPRPGTVVAADSAGIVVQCGEGRLRILTIQREGGRRMPVREFLAGMPVAAGEVWPVAPAPPATTQ